MKEDKHFKDLFKRFRLRSGFLTLSEFGKALADEEFVLEDSLFSRWQNGSRIPKERKVLIALIKIFMKKGGIATLKEANNLLASVGQGYLTDYEQENISESITSLPKPIPYKKIVDFARLIGQSKQILRSGWIRENIKNSESVAEHSFRLSVLSMVLADQLGVDKEKLIQMAILHDLGEVITGDLVWSRGEVIDMKKRTEKEELEERGIKKIFKLLGMSDQYAKLYEEMTDRKTREAKIFWQLDKLEMALQALEYEKSQNKKLDEFFINADLQIDFPFLKKIMKLIFKKRTQRNI